MSEEIEQAPTEATAEPPKRKGEGAKQRTAAARRHFRFGWWALFAFAGLGLVLESMQGLRVGWYLDVSNETRRLMFRLAHAHGTLLAIVNLVFALSLDSRRFGPRIGDPKIPSACFGAALILLPAGFFTGGLVIYDGDPGLGIMMVPVGALLFMVGALVVARSGSR